MKRDFLEEDMYDVIRDHFIEQGFRVRGEVRDCDVTAVKEDTLIVLELKKSLSIELLVQAVKRQKVSDLTYLCVPKPKNYRKNRKHAELLYLLKRLGLGLIYCEPEKERLEIVLHPQEFDMARSRRQNKHQRDLIFREIEGRSTSLNRGGSRGRKLMTAYREDAIRVLWLCAQLGGSMAPKDGTHLGITKTPAILRDNHYGWFEKTARGIYSISQAGQQALEENSSILDDVTVSLKQKLQAVAPGTDESSGAVSSSDEDEELSVPADPAAEGAAPRQKKRKKDIGAVAE